MITDDAIDSLFKPRQEQLSLEPARVTNKITCRACEQHRAAVEVGTLLCRECAGDIPATREHIQEVLTAHQRRLGEAWGALEQAVEAADEALLGRWNAFQEAITNGKPEAKHAEARSRAGMPGPLADLIRLWCQYKDAQAVYSERRRWADSAELTIALYVDEVL